MSTVYQKITNRIIELLEKGVVPWQKPWNAGISSCNYESRHEYTGINRLMTNCMGYTSPYWLSFNQIKKYGGMVNKGEQATPILYFNVKDIEKDGINEPKIVVKYSNIFNLQQTTIEAPPVGKLHDFTPIEVAENIINGYKDGPKICYAQNVTCYRPSNDTICMLEKSSYKSPKAFYQSLYHEMGHSTGSANRLNREGVANFDKYEKHRYGYEELIAEISASFLLNAAGINLVEQNAAYCDAWLKIIKADPKLIIKAASEAEKAANYILGEHAGVIHPSEEETATVQ